MDEIERRLIRVEEQIGALAEDISRMERAIEKMAAGIDQLSRAHAATNSLADRVSRIESVVQDMRKEILDARIVAAKAAAASAMLTGLAMLMIRMLLP